MSELQGWDVQPTEEVTPEPEVTDAALQEARDDVSALMGALRRIQNIDPASQAGGPSNKNFGLKGAQALQKAKHTALEALIAQTRREVTREHGA